MSESLTVVIPALNEEELLAACLDRLRREAGVEIIVADGGSRDGTLAVAASRGARCVTSAPGRGRQMNAGAALAGGQSLLFLHADTLLPSGFKRAVAGCLGQKGVAAGAFRLRIEPAGCCIGLGLVEWGANWRSRLLGLPYGDQALFLQTALFHELGGFPDLPLLEDFCMVRRLKKKGRIALLPEVATTSARRWQERGVVATTLLNQLIIAGFWAGLSPHFLARLYRGRQYER